MSATSLTEWQRAIIEEDRLNRLKAFNPESEFNPADLFILRGFSFGQTIWERNPRWHDDRGYFIGRTSQ
jgi:hypothetical protein